MTTMKYSLPPTLEESHQLIRTLAWNNAFGCFTRLGFENWIWPGIADQAKWIIYFDIDDVHALNAKYGSYDPVDAMISSVLAAVRMTDYVAGQWKSGDEFVVCITEDGSREPSDPEGFKDRLVVELAKQGMTATFSIVPVVTKSLLATVGTAVRQVYEIKNSRHICGRKEVTHSEFE